MYEDSRIISWGQAPYHKRTSHTTKWYFAQAVGQALGRAGVSHDEVDGLAVTSFLLPPDNVTTLAQEFGFELSWGFQGAYGGASGVISVLEAARAVSAGLASVVVCVAADAFTVSRHDELISGLSDSIRDYIAPLGFGGANGLFALVQRKHSHEYGTTREQLGKLAVTQRRHANRNPNALFQEPLTLDEYLEARVIADPIRLYDCVMPCSGADAVVVTSASRANEYGKAPVRILSGGQRHNYRHRDLVPVTQGWAAFASDLFTTAGCDHGDLDVLELYDDYPIMSVIQLEDLGFCAKGEGGPFVRSMDLSVTGPGPAVNTGGGQLSAGQAGASGGMIGVTEAVCQLQHEGGDRQFKEARMGLVSGFGMVSYSRGLSTSAMILTND